MEELQDQLAALKRRLAQEKEEKDRLAIENERLSRDATMETETVWQDRNTTKVERKDVKCIQVNLQMYL